MYNNKKNWLNLNINNKLTQFSWGKTEICSVKKSGGSARGLSLCRKVWSWCKDAEQIKFKGFHSFTWLDGLLWITVSWWTGSTLIWIPGNRRKECETGSSWGAGRAKRPNVTLQPDLGAACLAEDIPEPQRLVSCSRYDGLTVRRHRLYTTKTRTFTSDVCLNSHRITLLHYRPQIWLLIVFVGHLYIIKNWIRRQQRQPRCPLTTL